MIAIPIKNLPTKLLKEYGWIQDTLKMIFLDAFLGKRVNRGLTL